VAAHVLEYVRQGWKRKREGKAGWGRGRRKETYVVEPPKSEPRLVLPLEDVIRG